jgi:hypothetical protein
MLELNKISKVRPRVQALITQEKFASRSSDISLKIELMSTAFEKVKIADELVRWAWGEWGLCCMFVRVENRFGTTTT